MNKLKNNLTKVALSFVCLTIVGQSQAYDFQGCEVVEIVTAGEKNAHVRLNCVVEPRPACSLGNWFGFDKSTVAGQDFLKMIMMAYSTDSKVTGLVDDNICSTNQGNVSLLQHLRILKQ